MSGSYKLRPQPCVGYEEARPRSPKPRHRECPHAATVKKRYARRCKSCAAKQRKFESPWLYDYQLRKARELSPNMRLHRAKEMLNG